MTGMILIIIGIYLLSAFGSWKYLSKIFENDMDTFEDAIIMYSRMVVTVVPFFNTLIAIVGWSHYLFFRNSSNVAYK
jgi:hypothetical protein